MFTKHRWNVFNIQWHPVDDHPAITTTLTRSSHMLMHYCCFTNATPPVCRPWPQSSCYKTANRAPRNTSTICYRYSYAGKLVTCQQQFAQLHHVDLKHRGCRDVGVSASAVCANVMLQTYNVNFSGVCTTDADFFHCVILWYSNDGLWQHVRQS